MNWLFKDCPGRGGGRTWNLLVLVYFLSQKHHLRTLDYCAPLANKLCIMYFHVTRSKCIVVAQNFMALGLKSIWSI